MKKLSYIIKSSNVIYNCYYYVMSTLLKLLGLFCRVDNQLILFNSYGGKKYDDSPKVIYEAMKADQRFSNYRMVWALQNPTTTCVPQETQVVKADTFQYFVTALKARVWVTNSSIERGLNFKKEKTFCLNTWHGTAIKVMGIDVKANNKSFRSKNNVTADIMLTQGQYDIDVFSHAFELPLTSFRMTGLPRNDELANYTQADRNRIREKLGISLNKQIVLYAPTFREFKKGCNQEIIFDVPMNLQRWQDVLSDQFVILFRAHYEVARHMKVEGYSAFMDMSGYPDLNELMIVSDALISDYSSIYFDYAVTHKPMYCFAYDYDEYMSNRGMYLNLKEALPCAIHRDEEGLLKELLRLKNDENEKRQETEQFQKKYVMVYGNAAAQCCDLLVEKLKESTKGAKEC